MFCTECLPSFNWDLVSWANLAMPFNDNIDHCMGLVIPSLQRFVGDYEI